MWTISTNMHQLSPLSTEYRLTTKYVGPFAGMHQSVIYIRINIWRKKKKKPWCTVYCHLSRAAGILKLIYQVNLTVVSSHLSIITEFKQYALSSLQIMMLHSVKLVILQLNIMWSGTWLQNTNWTKQVNTCNYMECHYKKLKRYRALTVH